MSRNRSGPIRRIPCGLFGMFALVISIELLALHGDYSYISPHGASWRFTAKRANQAAGRREILCFGDSLVKFDVLPRVIREETARSCYNLAVYIGPAPASYFLLRRIVEAGARPKAIVVDFGMLQSEGPMSTARPYPWADLLDAREVLDLAATSRDPNLLASIVVARLLHSVKDRYEIRAAILSALRNETSYRRARLAALDRNWALNLGAQVQAKSGFHDEPPPPVGEGRRKSWRCDPVNAQYIDRFLELAARRQIAVYWLVPPLSPVMQAHEEHWGTDAGFTDFVRATQKRHAGITVVDARHSGYGDSLFADPGHLNRDGAAALSLALARILKRDLSRVGSAKPWVMLPHYVPATAPVEDVTESYLAVTTAAQRARR